MVCCFIFTPAIRHANKKKVKLDKEINGINIRAHIDSMSIDFFVLTVWQINGKYVNHLLWKENLNNDSKQYQQKEQLTFT
jgi:hypothetical protein